MGKVHFPLENIRRDIVGNWHLKKITEDITVSPSPNTSGYYTTFLTEIPDSGKNSALGSTPPEIEGLTEYKNTPINPTTKKILLTPSQFYVNYTTGELLFHPNNAGLTFTVSYYGKGSLIEADDLNALYVETQKTDRLLNLPKFNSFEIKDVESKFEVGTNLPEADVLTFQWELSDLSDVGNRGFKIENLSTGEVFNNGIEISNTETEFDVDYRQNKINLEEPGEIKFKISIVTIDNQEVSKEISYQWVDRVFFGVADITYMGIDLVKNLTNQLLNSADEKELLLNFPKVADQHFIFALPKRYNIKNIIDTNTQLSFIFNDPIEMNIINDNNISIPYNVYVSSYKIQSAVELKIVFGE